MELDTEQQKVIAKIAEENGFKDFEIKVEAGSDKGDNFMGTIRRVTIGNDEKNMVVIVKSAPKSEAIRKKQPTRKIFLREMYIYEKVFEEYAAFEEDYNISNRFMAHPKILGKCDKEFYEHLVLEDMRQKDFKMWNKKVSMNSYHIEAVLKEYAKLHSTCLAMKIKIPERFEKLAKELDGIWAGGNTDTPEEFLALIMSLMKNAYKAVEGDLLAIEGLKKYEKFLPLLIKDLGKKNKSSENEVITHGDCWCNNLLFKYKNENMETPSEVCIIDWQISRLSLPAADLAYFLFANGSKEILDDYKKYIKLYYDVVCQHLKDFSCDPGEVFPYEHLETTFSIACKYVFWFLLMVMKIQLCESDEAPDSTKDVDSGKNIEDIVNMDEYYRRIALLVKFLEKNNMF